jgi:hypothetical protein
MLILLIVDKNKKIERMEIRFPIPEDNRREIEAISSINAFLSSSHSLLEGERLSLEIHRVDDYITMGITTSHPQALESIKKFLTGVEGLAMYNQDEDILDSYRSEKKFTRYRLNQPKQSFYIGYISKVFFAITSG